MGTDIHWFVERRATESGEWSLLDGDVPFYLSEESPLVYRGRNYELFGALAGVRGVQSRMLPLRGLPSDVSPIVAACAAVDDGDCTAHSFAELAELQALQGKDFCDEVFASVLGEMQRLATVAPVRAVYWFDR